jgi:hypothetical protein
MHELMRSRATGGCSEKAKSKKAKGRMKKLGWWAEK